LWDERCAVGVVMAAGGYPDSYDKGDEITGLPEASASTKVFHAGTVLRDTVLRDKAVLTHGGRVLCVTALGNTVSEAQKQAYQTVSNIHWREALYRTDIAYRAIAREEQAN
ncbi:MAG: phosphoribosylamine--glycine ligase, partial [Porticoccaceae bacterium]|nr:phosphoribosylamine--glycine ligase [Porticoccaceae bacterium]